MRYDWCHCGAVIHVGTVTCATCDACEDACEDTTPAREAVR